MHEDHVGCPGFADFAPDALCIKPTRRARRSPALRETPLCKKAFNSGSAALVSALAALSEPGEAASDFLVGTIFSFRVICNLSQARRVLLKTAESLNARPLKCRVASCSGRSRASQGGFSRWRAKRLWDGGVAPPASSSGGGGAGAKQGVGETRGLKIEEGRRAAEGGPLKKAFLIKLLERGY